MKKPRSVPFSQTSIIGLPIPKRGRVQWWDSTTPHLCCRVSETGSKTFYWIGREAGVWKRSKLGKWPEMNVNGAKREANRLTGLAASGQAVTTRTKAAAAEWTLQELFDWYLENHSKPHKRTWQWDERQFKNRFLPWAKKPVSMIARAEVQKFHIALGESKGIYAANKMLELLGTMYRVGSQNEPDKVPCPDPTKGIKRFAREERERFLDADELPKFIEAVKLLEREVSRDFLMLCLWTGARRSNVAGMRWADVSLETAIWIIPRQDSKNKKPMNIALSPPALEILKRRKKTATGPFVLPGQGPTGHYNCPREAIAKVCELSGIKDLRVHDLRRTLGSWMAVNSPLQVVGKQLGHSSIKSTAIYARLANSTLKTAVGNATDAMVKAGKKKPKKS